PPTSKAMTLTRGNASKPVKNTCRTAMRSATSRPARPGRNGEATAPTNVRDKRRRNRWDERVSAPTRETSPREDSRGRCGNIVNGGLVPDMRNDLLQMATARKVFDRPGSITSQAKPR